MCSSGYITPVFIFYITSCRESKESGRSGENKNSMHFGQNSSKIAALDRSTLSCKGGTGGNIREMGLKVWARLYSCRIEFSAWFYEHCDKTQNSLKKAFITEQISVQMETLRVELLL
jgi:hypothetical protein